MKLTKQLEAEILKLYHGYWDANVRGDIKAFASYIDDNLIAYGTAKAEVFKSKKEAVKFYRATANQMKGKADFRNRKINVKVVGSTVVVSEECDLYVLAGKAWVFYGHARVTSVFAQKRGSWKVVHNHASFPDSRAEEGEQIATQKIKTENLQLKEAVQRRTVELEEKNKELQIEAALERVRTVAMAMKKAEDMLSICKTISQQLAKLGLKEIRNVQTAVIRKERGTYINYEFYAKHNKLLATEVSYTDHPMTKAFINKMLDGPNEFFKRSLKGKKVQEWYAFQKKLTKQFPDHYLLKATSLNYYWYSLGPIALGVSAYEPLSNEEQELIVRFRNVFELSYRRFLDIEKAEAQSREAQIELGLERVRARAMAMQNSDELAELVSVVFKELTHLGFSLTSCIIWISDQETSANTLWVTSAAMNKPAEPVRLKPFHHSFFHSIIHAWKEKDPKWIYTLTGKEKTNFERSFFANEPNMPVALKKALAVPKQVVFSASFNHFGALEILGTEPLTDEKFEILHRFGKVFDSSYTRFNDLKKAEAQAREAQIETALEKVRSRSLAMQKPEELLEVAELLRNEMGHLGVEELETSSIYIVDKENKKAECWYAIKDVREENTKTVSDEMLITLTDTWVGKEMWRFYQSSKTHISILMKNERRREWINYCANHSKVLQGYYGDVIPERTYHLVKFNGGYMGAASPGDISKESRDILKRAAAVFSLAYTRFKDLQDAAARARETQIELALERVRSRSMAMHKSEELKEVIRLLLDQFIHLNINAEHAGFYIDYKAHDDMHIWLADPNIEPFFAIIPYFDTPTWNSFLEAKAKARLSGGQGTTLHTDLLDFKTKNKFYKSLFKIFKVPEEAQHFYLKCKGLAVSTVLLDNVGLYIENFSAIPYTDEENNILIRFGKVFQQAYTRFLDLQKAEAQAREAQIEAALERVRSRSMAMYKSEELADLSLELVKQVQALGVSTWFCAFNINDDDLQGSLEWGSNGQGTFPSYRTPREGIFLRYYEAGQRGETLFINAIGENECPAHYEYLCTLPGVGEQLLAMKAAGIPFPAFQIDHVAFFKYGYILFITYEPVPDSHDIFKRFAKVFEQTYTRFLDLQKAEAQAREAQIEVAVERVRAKALAMHKSEDLHSVVIALKKELMGLRIPDITAATIYLEQRDGSIRVLDLSDTAEDDDDKPQLQLDKVFRLEDTDPDLWIRRMWNRNENYFVLEADENDFVRVVEWIRTVDPVGAETAEKIIKEKSIKKAWLPTVKLEKGVMNIDLLAPPAPEIENILLKMGAGFDLAYKRFLDLQKAEAQAREAQIELGLERVRARAMAMQKSDELRELIGTVFTELTKLDLVLTRCLIMIYDFKTKGSTWWMANSEAPSDPIGLYIKYHEYPPYAAYINAWQERKNKWQYILQGTDKKDWDDFLFTETELSQLPDFVIDGMKAPDLVYLNASFNNFGNLTLASLQPLSDEHFDILLRFAKVFDLTYTRFNDLQKAEAQAREAEIELALERVRARTMAMQKSDELPGAATLLFNQIQSLGMPAFAAGYCIWEKDKQAITLWMSSEGVLQPPFKAPTTEDELFIQMRKGYEQGKLLHVVEMGGEYLVTHYKYMRTLPIVGKIFDSLLEAGHLLPVFQVMHQAYFSKGFLLFITYESVPSAHDIFIRFANVFDQTYTRFLDLQKAEAQAKEAQIEAALEKVRTAAMSMMTSAQLLGVCEAIYNQLLQLGFLNLRCTQIYILNDEKQSFSNYEYADTFKGRIVEIDYNIHPKITSFVNDIKITGAQLVEVVIHEEEIDEWRSFLYGELHQSKELLLEQAKELYYNHYAIDNGALSISTFTQLTGGQKLILERLRNVFGLSYKRYKDLAQAEMQAHEAKIEASLERVRSKAMSMHNSQDLADTIGVFYNELTSYSITPRRCGVGLLNKENKAGELFTWNTTEQGESLELIGTIKMEGHPVLENVYNGWVSQTDYYPILRGHEIKEYYKVIRPMIPFPDYDHDTVQYGYFFFFREGGVYAWTDTEMKEEELLIYRRFTSVLSLTYKRYKDLQHAEAQAELARLNLIQIQEEKQRAENALTELQSAQKQLIQSEKMASLGELTAGIAHEIQNPLNFVNNFSEVSKELIKELAEEAQKGNTDEVKLLADDLIGNLHKIHHHGERAASIVKGMLQHSRTSSGQKELTDINALCDEYLRLAYHGLRAKDKSFNASFTSEFDASLSAGEAGISSINIAPQDMGRVILNLINNAFYAVNEKKKTATDYTPAVSVRTARKENTVFISVVDNGNGIPQKVLDKIFQPFFTTKPTGEGTGLGLSLSYDIVKAHGGELKVETKEGEGCTFIIQLPV
jgi:signal transduction histidine kinase/ketosteroid isomerase-like protein